CGFKSIDQQRNKTEIYVYWLAGRRRETEREMIIRSINQSDVSNVRWVMARERERERESGGGGGGGGGGEYHMSVIGSCVGSLVRTQSNHRPCLSESSQHTHTGQ